MREMTLATEWNRQSKRERSFRKKVPEIFINGKDAMAMLNVDEFESHRSGAFHAVFVSTRRAKPTVTVERDIFKVATMGAMIHGTAKGKDPHNGSSFDIFHFGVSGMESIFYFFIMVCKNFSARYS